MHSAFRYYQGIAQQLRAEVDSINSIFEHQGVKGEGNETLLRDLIVKFIPKRYGIGTGIVIDRNGRQSKQSDIIIYDTQLYPSFLSLAKVHFFPVDVVYATIEVKTTLGSGSAKQAQENIASVRALDFIKDKFMGSEGRGEAFNFINYNPDPPQGCVFAYNSDTQHAGTFKQWFALNDKVDISNIPMLVGCLDQGLLYYQNPARITLVRPEPGMLHKGAIFPLIDDEENPIAIPESTRTYMHGGSVYPVKKIGDRYIAIDQGRVLLFFLLMLNEMLSKKRLNPNLSFINSYFNGLPARFEI